MVQSPNWQNRFILPTTTSHEHEVHGNITVTTGCGQRDPLWLCGQEEGWEEEGDTDTEWGRATNDLMRNIVKTYLFNLFIFFFRSLYLKKHKHAILCKWLRYIAMLWWQKFDKFGNYWVRLKGQQGVFRPRFGLYLVLAGWNRIDLKYGNDQISHQFSSFYYSCCRFIPIQRKSISLNVWTCDLLGLADGWSTEQDSPKASYVILSMSV